MLHSACVAPLAPGVAELIPTATGDSTAAGRPVLINLDDAPTDPGDDPDANLAANRDQHNLEQFLVHGRNGFPPSSVAITHMFTEPAGFRGGRHRHLEAVLYIVDGNGYTNVEDRTVPWGPGDVMHLMSLVSPLDRDLAVVYSRLLPVPFHEQLLARGITLIDTPDAEFDSMGTNVLALAPRQCVMLEGNPLTRAALERAGVEVIEYAGTEISVKGAGGPTCLTRPLVRVRAAAR